MTIDIRGTTDRNKGAQLMLEAVVERLGDTPLSTGTALIDYQVRAPLRLHQTLHLNRFPRSSAILGGLVPQEIRTRYGLTADKQISGVVDASGFAYSDSFQPLAGEREVAFGARWAKRGVPKVLLPQAFGPFQKPQSRAIAAGIAAQSELIFARDEVSLRHLRSVAPSSDVRLSPDFTIGLAPAAVTLPLPGEFGVVVPNSKLVAKGIIDRHAYLSILSRYIEEMRGRGLQPVVLLHETNDRALAHDLASMANCQMLASDSPRVLKGILGHSRVVVASRFHAVVGGLSQGVPSIALGWSHKYLELLRDFEVPELNAEPATNPTAAIDAAIGDVGLDARLQSSKQRLMEKNEEMWALTREALGLPLSRSVASPYELTAT